MDAARPLLTEEAAYKALLQYFNGDGKRLNMAQLFQQDQGRFAKFRFADLPVSGRSFRILNYFRVNVLLIYRHFHLSTYFSA